MEEAVLFERAVDMFVGKNEVAAGVIVDNHIVLVIKGMED